MTAPERRRPLPALAVIGALCLLTAIVWFRVIHRPDGSAAGAGVSPCPAKPTHTVAATPKVVPRPATVKVLVLNSTQRTGIARATKRALARRGFTVTQATDDGPAYGGHGLIRGVAEIRYGPGALAAATLLRFYFPHAVLKATDSPTPTVTVALGAKYRTIASAQAVRRALRASHTTVGTPRPQPSSSASTGC